MVLRLDASAPDFEPAFARFLAVKREAAPDVRAVVAEIIAAVRAEGDAALLRFTERFDRVKLDASRLRVSQDEIDAAVAGVAPKERAALDFAAGRIEAYHRRQVPQDMRFTDETGTELGWRWRPVEAAGVYVPGGTAAYPSSVLMNAIPARVAGVARIAMTVPAPAPAPEGKLNPLVLAAAARAGVSEIYRVGGAQAVAALAYGTAAVAPVDVIVGPGNVYVAEAKRQVFGQVGIDLVAGPSEILVIAAKDSDPLWVAADLLSQAEHGEDAQAVLITDDEGFAERVVSAVENELATLARKKIARASWERFGAVILVKRLDGRGGARQPHRARACGNLGTRRGSAGPKHPQCGRDLFRRAHARGHRRLCRGRKPRAADGGRRALFLGAFRVQFSQAHLALALRRAGLRRAFAACDHARRSRRAFGACALS